MTITTLADSNKYIALFDKQRGGDLPVFVGARRYPYQGGAGLGDILRGLFRRVLPVAIKGVSSFFSGVSKAQDQGASFKDAAKSAIGPTVGALFESGKQQWNKYQEDKQRAREEAERKTEENKQV